MPEGLVMDNALLERIAALHQESFGWALACADRDRQGAEDVLQAVYLKVLEGRARYEGRSSLKTWLFAVIRRTASEQRRFGVVRRLLPLVRGEDVPDAGPLPDEQVETADRRAQLERALGQLPRRQREVVMLVFYHEHTVEEAAQVLGIGIGSARTHYARGKARLRELLGEVG
jgi:RNA polymerase sigma-70 factor (ECF subfamily)